MLGLSVRIMTIAYVQKGTYGRNVERQVADALNTTGIYSIVRHPLYLGNYLMWLGMLMFVGIWWFLVIVSLMFWLYYERIMIAEEAFLRNKFKKQYEDWAAVTPAFLPKFSLWKKSNLSFSAKNVVKREFYGLFAASTSFVYVNLLRNYFYNNNLSVDFFWQVIFFTTLLLFVVLRFMKKKTNLLKVDNR